MSNDKLEELLKRKFTPDVKEEFLNILKDSRLFVPVVFKKNSMGGGQFAFDIDDLPDGHGCAKKIVPVFTRHEKIKGSSIMISMKDLAELIKHTDEYSAISVDFSFDIPFDEFLALFGIVSASKIEEIKNDIINLLLGKDGLSDDELVVKLSDSTVITAWADDTDGTNTVPVFDRNDNVYFPVFSDLDEFNKVFDNDSEDVYPQAYGFLEAIEFARDDVMINPASQAYKISLKKLRSKK